MYKYKITLGKHSIHVNMLFPFFLVYFEWVNVVNTNHFPSVSRRKQVTLEWDDDDDDVSIDRPTRQVGSL